MSITTEEYLSLSMQDRAYYNQHKDEQEMVVINGKLHLKVYNNQPYTTWQRLKELLKLADNLTEDEAEILHFNTDFNDWNTYSRPYIEHGFYYFLTISARSCGTEKVGIQQNAKDWLVDWLTAHGFSPEEIATVRYTGGFSYYTKEKGFYESKTYTFEIRCRFTDIPPHFLPIKVHNWVKRNKQYKHLVFGKENQ